MCLFCWSAERRVKLRTVEQRRLVFPDPLPRPPPPPPPADGGGRGVLQEPPRGGEDHAVRHGPGPVPAPRRRRLPGPQHPVGLLHAPGSRGESWF